MPPSKDLQPSGAENNNLTRILCTTVGPVTLLMLKKGLCSTVQPNMVTQPTFNDAEKAETRLLYNFLKSLSSINNLRKKLDYSGTYLKAVTSK